MCRHVQVGPLASARGIIFDGARHRVQRIADRKVEQDAALPTGAAAAVAIISNNSIGAVATCCFGGVVLVAKVQSARVHDGTVPLAQDAAAILARSQQEVPLFVAAREALVLGRRVCFGQENGGAHVDFHVLYMYRLSLFRIEKIKRVCTDAN